ncbi:hypothetical protein HYS00_01910 [Candidatus Microgenomates bacterium]|nr:hypothetical protein [Candidatus Microgenomates bacterium]
MVKGLGSLQFIAVLFLASLIEQRKESFNHFIKLCIGFIATIAPWHLFALVRYPKEFLGVYIYDDIIKRSMYAIENHHEHWYFYIKLLISEFFPWIVFICIAPIQLFRRLSHIRSLKQLKVAWSHNRILFTLILLVILPLISLTRVMTKLSWYAMPVQPFLAILIAFYITVFLRKFSSSAMRGQFGASVLNVVFAIVTILITIDAFTVISHNVRFTRPDRVISARDEAILKTRAFTNKQLEYLVPFGERQGRMALPANETVAHTWIYGGTACAVYYSDKQVNYEYNTSTFVQKMQTSKGLYLIENGDLHYVTDVKNKKKVFENREYTIFKN